MTEGSKYIEAQRRAYSIYVMQSRAIPVITDGLKHAARRLLWIGRDGKNYKSATLAGLTMDIHPHDAPESTINTLAAHYGNNVPLLTGDGAFGTLLEPYAFGASRYTHAAVSKFTQDVVFRDIEIIPMRESYDGHNVEPVHFLPLVPIAFLNPSEGIAIGFKTDILPRSLEDLIMIQIQHLNGVKTIKEPMPVFLPLDNAAHKFEVGEKGTFYYFDGEYEEVNATTVRVTKLPFGLAHESFIDGLEKLYEKGLVTDWTDGSKDVISVVVTFKKGVLRGMDHTETLKTLGLSVRHSEILNVLDFDGKAVISGSVVSLVRQFTDWRLKWYENRYQRLHDILKKDLQRYYDIRTAINKKINEASRKAESRSELRELIESFGIVNVDYIADLPVYRFTKEEYAKNEAKIHESELQLQLYLDLLASEPKRRKVYITELQEVLGKYNKGQYK